jgi:hypothetical protein
MGDYSIGFINKDGILTNPIANVYYSGAFFSQGTYTETIARVETIAGLGIDTADKTANNFNPTVISTPLNRSDYVINAPNNVLPQDVGQTGFGYYDGLGFKYSPPTPILRAQRYTGSGFTAASYVTVTAKPSLCRRFTSRYFKTNTDNYGLAVFGQYGPSYGLVLDHSKTPLLLQRTTTGKVLSTATANNYPTTPNSSGTTNKKFFSLEIAGNVIFPKPFTDPPLIFITYSSAPIALYSMNKDANGKYISATIICSPGRLTDTNFPGYGYSWLGVNKSATFTYFITSEELPTTVNTDNVGMRVYDSTGTKILFRNDYEIPAMTVLQGLDLYVVVSLPASGATNLSFPSGVGTLYANEGVCINNFPAINQIYSYEYHQVTQSAWVIANVLSGIYLNVLSGSFTVSAAETNMYTNLNRPTAVYSITFGQAGAVRPILKASYQPL